VFTGPPTPARASGPIIFFRALSMSEVNLTPQTLVRAYAAGVFPMAGDRHGEIAWFSAEPRGILPLDRFRVPRSMRKRPDRDFRVTCDRAFRRTIEACATPRRGEPTWINDAIIEAYTGLHARGLAHSVEAWDVAGDQPRLAGGLYGVSLGAAFFGESMFHRTSDASKVALLALVERLVRGGYVLLDIQMVSPLLARFGACEISRAEYLARLQDALARPATWRP